MESHLNTLLKCPLFKNISPTDLLPLLSCLKTHTKTYDAGQYIFSLGEEVNYIGVILSGQLELVKENMAGNRTIVAFLGPSHIFGEGIVCTSRRISPISVHARTSSTILLIPYHQIVHSCAHACSFHQQLIANMLRILGDKNYLLNTKMDLLILKGIQEKLITYLLGEALKHNSLYFEIIPNRNELAEFLNVSRPSMCRELAKLKEENLIDYHKNNFRLKDAQRLKDKLRK
ncbi:MAG: Crp/Fnr family transcriptional regulator [Cellulosilyticaceae bacterium]